MKNFIATFILLCLSALSAHAVQINGQLEKAGLERLASDPTGFDGRLYFNTGTGATRIYKSSAWGDLNASGNVVGQASSVDGEIALFSGTGGKTIARATGTGLAQVTSGVYAALAASTQGNVVRSNGTAWVSAAPSLISGTNASPNADRMERIRWTTTCTTGTCTLSANSGGATNVTWTSTGNYSINWAGSIWTAAPQCVCATSANVANSFCVMNSSSTSTTVLLVYDSAGVSSNEQLSILCMGAR